MFTLAPVPVTLCEVLIKDEATAMKCENTAGLIFLSLLSTVPHVSYRLFCKGVYAVFVNGSSCQVQDLGEK